MNAKDFLRFGVPLGEATRRATDFVAKFIIGDGRLGGAACHILLDQISDRAHCPRRS
jgi:hypothetical protein